MARYELRFKPSVAKDLRNLPKQEVQRIMKCIEALRDDPRAPGCTKLSGVDLYRVRQGVYRVVYAIDDDTVTVEVVRVGHRGDVYRSN
jgi:mRNA interferase RelE/StbE